jgi:putative transposase
VAVALWRDGDPDARKLKGLEEENRKLKKLLAETMLDASTLKEMLGKNF